MVSRPTEFIVFRATEVSFRALSGLRVFAAPIRELRRAIERRRPSAVDFEQIRVVQPSKSLAYPRTTPHRREDRGAVLGARQGGREPHAGPGAAEDLSSGPPEGGLRRQAHRRLARANPDKLESPKPSSPASAPSATQGPRAHRRCAAGTSGSDGRGRTVQEAGEVQLGRQRAPQHHTGDHIRPYLRVANVLEDALDLRDVKEMNLTPEEFETFATSGRRRPLNEGQAPELLGRPAIYRDQIPGCCYQKTLLRFRPGPAVNSEFALIVFRHYMRSGRFKKIPHHRRTSGISPRYASS